MINIIGAIVLVIICIGLAAFVGYGIYYFIRGLVKSVVKIFKINPSNIFKKKK
jgi:hypothetical protein